MSIVVEKNSGIFLGCFCSAILTFLIVEDIHDAPSEVYKVPESVAHTFQCLNCCVASLCESIVIACMDSVPDFFFPLLCCL